VSISSHNFRNLELTLLSVVSVNMLRNYTVVLLFVLQQLILYSFITPRDTHCGAVMMTELINTSYNSTVKIIHGTGKNLFVYDPRHNARHLIQKHLISRLMKVEGVIVDIKQLSDDVVIDIPRKDEVTDDLPTQGIPILVHGIKFYVNEVIDGIAMNASRFDKPYKEDDLRRLQLLMPTNYSVGICYSAFILNPVVFDCNYKDVSNKTLMNNLDLVVGYDVFSPAVFQHDYINGIPSTAMLVDWVLSGQQRAILCAPTVCDLLKSVDGIQSSHILHFDRFPLYVRSFRLAFIDWHFLPEDTYPMGAYFPQRSFLQKKNIISPIKSM